MNLTQTQQKLSFSKRQVIPCSQCQVFGATMEVMVGPVTLMEVMITSAHTTLLVYTLE